MRLPILMIGISPRRAASYAVFFAIPRRQPASITDIVT
jgi:hypothetical protein